MKVMAVDDVTPTARSHIERLVRLCGANLTSYVAGWLSPITLI